MRLTVEAFWNGDWRECGTIEILDAQLGYRGPSIVEYDIDYFTNFAAADYSANGEVGDARAMSVRFPVDLESRYLATWPPFLLDLMLQGHARRKLADHLGLRVDARESDLPLLLRAAGSPVGNVRIKQAAEAERERLKNVTPNAPKISLTMGVPAEVVDFAMSGCAELVGKVLDAAASAPGV